MAADNVKSFEKESFRKHLSQLAQGTIADAAFADAIYQAVAAHGLSEAQFRDALGLSGGTVERWTMGKNLPQPMVRAKILNWISQTLEN